MRLLGNACIANFWKHFEIGNASLQGSVSRKNSLHHMFFSCLLKRYGRVVKKKKKKKEEEKNDTKLETTRCFIAKKITVDETLFCTGSLWEAF